MKDCCRAGSSRGVRRHICGRRRRRARRTYRGARRQRQDGAQPGGVPHRRAGAVAAQSLPGHAATDLLVVTAGVGTGRADRSDPRVSRLHCGAEARPRRRGHRGLDLLLRECGKPRNTVERVCLRQHNRDLGPHPVPGGRNGADGHRDSEFRDDAAALACAAGGRAGDQPDHRGQRAGPDLRRRRTEDRGADRRSARIARRPGDPHRAAGFRHLVDQRYRRCAADQPRRPRDHGVAQDPPDARHGLRDRAMGLRRRPRARAVGDGARGTAVGAEHQHLRRGLSA